MLGPLIGAEPSVPFYRERRFASIGRGKLLAGSLLIWNSKKVDIINEDFRTLAKSYATLSEGRIVRLLDDEDLKEICRGDENQVQERYFRGDPLFRDDAPQGRRARQGGDVRFRHAPFGRSERDRAGPDQADSRGEQCESAGLRSLPQHERKYGREVGDRGQAAERHGAQAADGRPEARPEGSHLRP